MEITSEHVGSHKSSTKRTAKEKSHAELSA